MLERYVSSIFVLLSSMRFLIFISILWSASLSAQLMIEHSDEVDMKRLNQLIITEVNAIRKKAKVQPLKVDTLLFDPALKHSQYLLRKRKLSHKQCKKLFRWPKNRVEFYGIAFTYLAENIQYFNMQTPVKLKGEKTAESIGTYKRIAKQLVENWENSKTHYQNIITPEFTSTYTTICVDENRNLYACQLFRAP